MKLLITTLLTLSVFQVMALDVNINGESRARFTTAETSLSGEGSLIDGLLDESSIELRNKISASFRGNESFEAHSSLYLMQNGITNASNQDMFVAVYGDWMISDELMVRVGQTQYELGNGFVLGSNDFQAMPTFFSGAIFTYSSRAIGLDVGLIEGPSADSGNLLVASLDIRSLPRNVRDANIHAVVTNAEDYGDEGSSSSVHLGGSVKGNLKRDVSYSVTISSSDISDVQNSYLADAYVKYRMDDINALVGLHSEGDQYSALSPEVHYNAGKMDIVQFGQGLRYGRAGAYYMVNRDISVGAMAYYFLQGNDSVSDGDIEVDVSVKNKFNSSISGKVVAGMFKSGENSSIKAYANLSMKF